MQAGRVRQEGAKLGTGKRGGGNAPRESPPEIFTIDDVIEIVNLAKRPYLGLMVSHQGRVILIRAWSHHAVLKGLGRTADYDFEAIPIPAIHSARVPRVAMVPCTCAFVQHARTSGVKPSLDRGFEPLVDSRRVHAAPRALDRRRSDEYHSAAGRHIGQG